MKVQQTVDDKLNYGFAISTVVGSHQELRIVPLIHKTHRNGHEGRESLLQDTMN